ncbi:MAG: hypothetical protein WDN24_03435 [Sphingomonas sp.]
MKLSASFAMLGGLAVAWLTYIRYPRFRRRSSTISGWSTASCSTNVFRRALRLPVRAPCLRDRAAALEGRRRGRDRPLRAERLGGGGQVRQRARGPPPVRIVYVYAFIMLIGLTAALTWAILP